MRKQSKKKKFNHTGKYQIKEDRSSIEKQQQWEIGKSLSICMHAYVKFAYAEIQPSGIA